MVDPARNTGACLSSLLSRARRACDAFRCAARDLLFPFPPLPGSLGDEWLDVRTQLASRGIPALVLSSLFFFFFGRIIPCGAENYTHAEDMKHAVSLKPPPSPLFD